MIPEYEHTQKPSRLFYYIPFAFVLYLMVIIVVIYLMGTHGQEALPDSQLRFLMLLIPIVPGLIIGWALLMMSSLTVTVNQEAIRLRFGPGMWKKSIPLENVINCRPTRNFWAHGWGIHYLGNGCWLYNISGLDAVEIIFKDGKRTRIGTDEPHRLADVILEAAGLKTAV